VYLINENAYLFKRESKNEHHAGRKGLRAEGRALGARRHGAGAGGKFWILDFGFWIGGIAALYPLIK